MSTEKTSLKTLERYFTGIMSSALIEAWEQFPKDKPARRQFINDYADSLIRNYNYVVMKMEFDEKNIPQDLPEYVLEEIQEGEDNIDNIVKSHIKWFVENTISKIACRDKLTAQEILDSI